MHKQLQALEKLLEKPLVHLMAEMRLARILLPSRGSVIISMGASLKRVVIVRIMRVRVMVLELEARMRKARGQRLVQPRQQLDLVGRVPMQGARLGQRERPIWILRWELLREELPRIGIRQKVLLQRQRPMMMRVEAQVIRRRVEGLIVRPQILIVHQQLVDVMVLMQMHPPQRKEVRQQLMI